MDIRGTLRVIRGIPGLLALILFGCFNNFLAGAFMALMDAYGLSLVSVQVWGLLWGALSALFIVGGLGVAKTGLTKNPLRLLLLVNVVMWSVTILFPLRSSIVFLAIGMAFYMLLGPYAEASEQTLLQKVVPYERQGRVFGFAQSVELAASPLTAFLIGPLTQLIFIPFMTDGAGADTIGGWFGTGADRGIALVFVLTGADRLDRDVAGTPQPVLPAAERAVHAGAGVAAGSKRPPSCRSPSKRPTLTEPGTELLAKSRRR